MSSAAIPSDGKSGKRVDGNSQMLRAAVATAFTAVATAVAFQEAPRAITLRRADATLGEPFTNINSVRELADGRFSLATQAETIGSSSRIWFRDACEGSETWAPGHASRHRQQEQLASRHECEAPR